MRYCPKCGSRLFPVDASFMAEEGVCSACATWSHDAAFFHPDVAELHLTALASYAREKARVWVA